MAMLCGDGDTGFFLGERPAFLDELLRDHVHDLVDVAQRYLRGAPEAAAPLL